MSGWPFSTCTEYSYCKYNRLNNMIANSNWRRRQNNGCHNYHLQPSIVTKVKDMLRFLMILPGLYIGTITLTSDNVITHLTVVNVPWWNVIPTPLPPLLTGWPHAQNTIFTKWSLFIRTFLIAICHVKISHPHSNLLWNYTTLT